MWLTVQLYISNEQFAENDVQTISPGIAHLSPQISQEFGILHSDWYCTSVLKYIYLVSNVQFEA